LAEATGTPSRQRSVLHNAAPCEQQRQQQSRLLLLQLLAATSQTFELQLAL
jgi:hypothetical protein